MAFWATNAVPYARQSGELIIELNKRNDAPPPPYELLGSIQDETYQQRMKALLDHLKRFSWSTMERVYVMIALAMSFIMPWPIMFLINRAFLNNINLSDNQTDQFGNPILTSQQVSQIANARLVTFGVLVGMFILIWAPYSVFKFIGRRRLRAMLSSWNAQDTAPPRPQHTHLTWAMRNSSTFHGRAQVVVNLPLGAMGNKGGSSFHPNAYLPAYIAQPGAYGGGQQPEGVYLPPQGPPPGQELNDEKV